MKKTKNHQAKLEKYLTKYWPIMASIVTALFLTAGVVLTTIDNKYLKSLQYLLTTLLLVISINYITDKNFKAKKQTELKFFLLSTGFILTIVGLETHAGVWVIGMILIAASLCEDKK